MGKQYLVEKTRTYDAKNAMNVIEGGKAFARVKIIFGVMRIEPVTFSNVILIARVTDSYEIELEIRDCKGTLFSKFYTPMNKIRRNGLYHFERLELTETDIVEE